MTLAAHITPEILLEAYRIGVFPMAEHENDPEVFWVDPRRRGIFPMDGFHVSRSLGRRMRRGGYGVTLNQDFDGVLAHCADRTETWISTDIARLYRALHLRGAAHSIEVWQDGMLCGGVYGVTCGAAFFGESMFSTRSDASKLALTHLVDHLRRCGFRLFDTQFTTPHLIRLGAVEVPRKDYHMMLNEAVARPADIMACPLERDPQEVLQRMTQTS